mgnify:CR=1 FL=1
MIAPRLRSRLAAALALLAALLVAVASRRIDRERGTTSEPDVRPPALDDDAAGRIAALGSPQPLLADAVEETSLMRPMPLEAFRCNPFPLLVSAALALVAMIIFAIAAPKAAAGGWLAAFVFWSGLPVGSTVALMIHRLTGGRWGWRIAPVMLPSAATVPLMAALFLPVVLAPKLFLPWAAAAPSLSSLQRDVAQIYFNFPFFILRSLAAFILWSVIAFVLPRLSGRRGVLLAAVGLILHVILVSLLGGDWIFSLQPAFISTSFGATLTFFELASVLAWALVLSPGAGNDDGTKDVGGLLLATLLGITYINFIAVLVIWYGNLPDKVFWFVDRDAWPWRALAIFAFLAGSIGPIFALFPGRVRRDPRALQAIAVIALIGFAAYFAYLVVPPFGLLALASTPIAIIAMGSLILACSGSLWGRRNFHRWRSASAEGTDRAA